MAKYQIEIELPAMRYLKQAMDFVHKHGGDYSNHHMLAMSHHLQAMVDDIKRDHVEDARAPPGAHE
jgi:hypothetical protein